LFFCEFVLSVIDSRAGEEGSVVEGRPKLLTIGNRFWGVEWNWEGFAAPINLALNG
jgi:hypothetical protein